MHIGKNPNIIREFLSFDIHFLTMWSVEVAAEDSGTTHDCAMSFDFPAFDGCHVRTYGVDILGEEDREGE